MLLTKTRQELATMVPQSADAGQLENNPIVHTIKEQLNALEQIRQQKEKVMNDGVAMND